MIPEIHNPTSPIAKWTGNDLVQILTDFDISCSNEDNNPEKIRLGFEVLTELFSNKPKCKESVEFIDSNFKIFPLPKLIRIIEAIITWKAESYNVSFQMLTVRWNSKIFKLSDFFLCTLIGQEFFAKPHVFQVLRNQTLSSEADHFLWLIEQTSTLWVNEKVLMDEVISSQRFIARFADKAPSETLNPLDFLQIIKALYLFGPKSRLKLNTIPLLHGNILSEWGLTFRDSILPPYELVKMCVDELSEMDIALITKKIHDVVLRKHDFKDLSDEQKFSKKEMITLLVLENIFRSFPHTEQKIMKSMSQFRKDIIPLCLPHEDNPITIAIYNQYAEVTEDYHQCTNVVEKVAFYVLRFFIKLFVYYGHIFFIRYHQEENTFIAHGKMCSQKTYSKPYVLPSRYVENYSIDTDALQPSHLSEEDKQRFAKRFHVKLESLISERRVNPPIGALGVYRLFLPSFSETRPDSVRLTEGEKLTCVQYVAQAIIQAHVETLREFNARAPESLTFYGFNKNQRIDRLRPNQFLTALREKGVLKPLFKPYLSDRSQQASA